MRRASCLCVRTGRADPIARSLEVLGDPWVMLVLRQAFSGVRRFEQFRDQLGVAENVLSKRLSTMVDADCRRVPYQDRRRTRHEYILTRPVPTPSRSSPRSRNGASGIGHTRTQEYGWTSSTATADTGSPLRTSAVTVASA